MTSACNTQKSKLNSYVMDYYDEESRRSFIPRLELRGYNAANNTKTTPNMGKGTQNMYGLPEYGESDFNSAANYTYTSSYQNSKGENKTERTELPALIATGYRGYGKMSLQSRVYNFLERPTGWKCFIYHFTV